MKLTRKHLQSLILNEIKSLRLNESRVSQEVYTADPVDLLAFGDAYASLGDNIQEQVRNMIDLQDPYELTPDAHRYVEERLTGFNEMLDDLISTYTKENQ